MIIDVKNVAQNLSFGSVGEDDFVSGLDSLLAASVSEELVFLPEELPFLP